MKWLLLAVLLVGCNEQPTKVETIDWSVRGVLADELHKAMGERDLVPRVHISKPEDCDALPVVAFKVGDKRHRVERGGSVLVPVYLDTWGRDTFGALLFVELDRIVSTMGNVAVQVPLIPGTMFGGSSAFFSGTAYAAHPGRLNMLAIFWTGVEDGETIPVTAEELADPLFWFTVYGERLGRATITWDALPPDIDGREFVFFRRAEMLVERACYTNAFGSHTWSVLDYYTSPAAGFNTTGTITVQGGSVVVSPL